MPPGRSRACLFRDHMEGVTSGHCDIAGGRFAEARDLIRQIRLGASRLIAHPVFEQVILDHMQHAEPEVSASCNPRWRAGFERIDRSEATRIDFVIGCGEALICL
jgi:hypothetical protein